MLLKIRFRNTPKYCADANAFAEKECNPKVKHCMGEYVCTKARKRQRQGQIRPGGNRSRDGIRRRRNRGINGGGKRNRRINGGGKRNRRKRGRENRVLDYVNNDSYDDHGANKRY